MTCLVGSWEGERPANLKILTTDLPGTGEADDLDALETAFHELTEREEFDRTAAFELIPGVDFYFAGFDCLGDNPENADPRLLEREKAVFSPDSSTYIFYLVTPQGERVYIQEVLQTSTILSGDTQTFYAILKAPNALPVTEGQSIILTPHAGEAARLLACRAEDVQRDRIAAAQRIVERYHGLCVLKGARTVVAATDGRTYVCEAGNPFMAMGGMGDLLSGVIAARWAYLKDDFLAARAAVWLHAAASDALVEREVPVDPSVVNTAAQIGSLRVALERRPDAI